MQARWRTILSTFLHGIIEFLAFFPILLLITVLTVNETVYYLLSGMYLLFVLLAITRLLIKQRPVVLVIALIVTSLFTVVIGENLLSYNASFILVFVASYRGVQYTESNWEELLPTRILWAIGLPCYFVGYLLFSYIDSLTDFRGVLSGVGTIFLIVMLFVTNKEHLQKESLNKGKKHRTSQEMKRMNYFYLTATILVVFLLTNFQVIQSFLYHSVRTVLQAFVSFIELFSSDEPPMEEPPQQSTQPMLPTDEVSEPSRFAEIMEQIGIVIGIILVILAVLVMLSLIFKKVRNLVKKTILFIWNALKQVFTSSRSEETDSEYTDEKENLFDWKNWRKEKQEEIKARLQTIFGRRVKYEQLSSEEKVRFLFREISRELRKQDKWKPSMTAHEVLNISEKEYQELQQMYDHVRYGEDTLAESYESDLTAIWNKLQRD
ncbi:hypothetical protein SAMN04487944_110138 [Gracilibacillus ureilyticus]|uniref:DUF4129 domain-containing protein n=1 Tax=Gracilibacillus ureilyticus TaxID=531814 RepID=A0A1H9S8V7_9BACI|nr:hypothetical protein [Gracilibacillus ureilyticus]SER81437.1 hypothetical protein SAMN04487944_110138 [Gracilibacillus ureilyticus]